MNIIYLAFCWGDSCAILGGILFSATHAFLSALMFFLVDCIYRRYHTRSLVEINGIPIDIIGVPTIRENDGLAMSSRNALLEPLHRELAPIIYESMIEVKKRFFELPVNNLKLLVEQRLQALPEVKLDYVEIADSNTLQPVTVASEKVKARIFVAAFFGKIRLIDNLDLN